MKAKADERLLGSSEIIESVFGKLKNLEQDQVKSGFTAMLLSLAAVVSTTSRDIIQKALETVVARKNSIQRFHQCGQGNLRLLQNL